MILVTFNIQLPVYYIYKKYNFYLNHSKDEEIVVATTRPETLFGDTAIAVNPLDPR